MIKNILILLTFIILTSCADIQKKLPKFEKKACSEVGKVKTLADQFCDKTK